MRSRMLTSKPAKKRLVPLPSPSLQMHRLELQKVRAFVPENASGLMQSLSDLRQEYVEDASYYAYCVIFGTTFCSTYTLYLLCT